MQAFSLCKVRGWDLSYESLTSPQIRARLRKEEAQDTAFWRELKTKKADDDLPPDNKEVMEDCMPRVDRDEEDGLDDSDVSVAAVIADVAKQHKGHVARKAEGGGLRSTALAEDL